MATEMIPKEILDNLGMGLIKKIDEGIEIRPEQLRKLMEIAVGIIRRGETNNLPVSFGDLSRIVQKHYQYGHIEKMNPDRAFDFGVIWSVVLMVETIEGEKEEEARLDLLARINIEFKTVLIIMDTNGGMSLVELMEKSGKSEHDLRLFLRSLDNERLFSYNRVGKTVIYYLEERGRELLNKMKCLSL